MTKAEILDILLLLSALESWGFSTKNPFPDYLHEMLANSVDNLSTKLLAEEPLV